MKRPDALPYEPIELASTVEGFVDCTRQLDGLVAPAFASVPILDSANGDKISLDDAIDEAGLRYDPYLGFNAVADTLRARVRAHLGILMEGTFHIDEQSSDTYRLREHSSELPYIAIFATPVTENTGEINLHEEQIRLWHGEADPSIWADVRTHVWLPGVKTYFRAHGPNGTFHDFQPTSGARRQISVEVLSKTADRVKPPA